MFKDYKISYIEKNLNITGKKQLSYLRQTVAYALSQSTNSIPHAAMITDYDVTPLIEYAKNSEKKLTLNSDETPENFRLRRAVRRNFSAFFLKAIAHTFAEMPDLPMFMDYRIWRGRGTLYYTEDINISYTVNTKYGVIKPILRNAHKKTLVQVAQEMRTLTRKARRTDANELYRRMAIIYLKCALRELNFSDPKGFWMLLRSFIWGRDPVDPGLAGTPEDQKLQPSDIMGATCTLANNGMAVSGNQTQTIITPPELYMLGISDLHQAAWIVDGQVVPRTIMTLFVSIDHRALDAGEGFPFLSVFGEYLKHPDRIYEWESDNGQQG